MNINLNCGTIEFYVTIYQKDKMVQMIFLFILGVMFRLFQPLRSRGLLYYTYAYNRDDL